MTFTAVVDMSRGGKCRSSLFLPGIKYTARSSHSVNVDESMIITKVRGLKNLF